MWVKIYLTFSQYLHAFTLIVKSYSLILISIWKISPTKKMCFPCYKLAYIKISSKRDRYSWTYLGCVDLLSKRKALYKNMGTYQNLKGEIKEIKVYCLTNQIQIDLIVYLQISQPPYYLAQIISQLLHYLNYFAVLDKFQLINEFM